MITGSGTRLDIEKTIVNFDWKSLGIDLSLEDEQPEWVSDLAGKIYSEITSTGPQSGDTNPFRF